MGMHSQEMRRLMRVPSRQAVRARAARRAQFHSEATMDSTSGSAASGGFFKNLFRKVKVKLTRNGKQASGDLLTQSYDTLIAQEDIELQTSSESDTSSLTEAEIVAQSDTSNLLVTTVNGVVPTQLPFTMSLSSYEFAKKLALDQTRAENTTRLLLNDSFKKSFKMFLQFQPLLIEANPNLLTTDDLALLTLPTVPTAPPFIPRLDLSKLSQDLSKLRLDLSKLMTDSEDSDSVVLLDSPGGTPHLPSLARDRSRSHAPLANYLREPEPINHQKNYNAYKIAAVVIGTTVVVGLIIGGVCFLLTPAVVALMIGKVAIAVASFVANNPVPVAGVAVAAGVAVIGLVSFKKHLNEVSESADSKKSLVLLA